MPTPNTEPPNPARPGATVWVTRAAGAQFSAVRPFPFVILRVYRETHTPEWLVWLDGYQLTEDGQVVERRDILVNPAALWLAQRPPARDPGPRRRPPVRKTSAEDAILPPKENP